MKTVKFNGSTNYPLIPDNEIEAYRKEIAELKNGDLSKRQQFVGIIQEGGSSTRYGFIEVKIGDVRDVPDWYYNANKNNEVILPISSDKYKNKEGEIIPFNMQEHIRHGHATNTNTIQIVKLFDLVADVVDKTDKEVNTGHTNKK